MNNDQIEMTSETVRMRFDPLKARWFVDCVFVFKNAGPDTVVTMGFPDDWLNRPEGYLPPGVAEDRPEPEEEWSLQNFTALVDGKPMATDHVKISTMVVKDVREDGAYVWNVKFLRGETKVIKNTYDVGLGGSSGGGTQGEWDFFSFTYIVTSGARWNGRIGEAEFIIDLLDAPGSPLFEISPTPDSVKRGVYYIRRKNFEPDFDIKVNGFGIPGLHCSRIRDLYPADGPTYLQKMMMNRQPGVFEIDYGNMDKYTLWLFRNFIFALYGRPFQTAELKDYFFRQDWHIVCPDYNDKMIPKDYEGKLIELIAKQEAKARE